MTVQRSRPLLARLVLARLVLAWVVLAAAALAGCDGPPGPATGLDAVRGLERRSIMVDGIRLSYVRAGDPNGRRVLFVHGTPGDAGA